MTRVSVVSVLAVLVLTASAAAQQMQPGGEAPYRPDREATFKGQIEATWNSERQGAERCSA